MADINGYNGKILRVDLSQRAISVDEPDGDFYRRYIGGSGFTGYFLLKELDAGEDALGPGNKLIFATGAVTGAPIAGSGRNSVGAKSPLTNGYSNSEVGGYWGAELKHAGYDAIIIEGKSESPVYLWINDGKVEIRDARHLWGKTTSECKKLIQEELRDGLVRIAQIGPAGENMVRYACILNDLSHAAGRSGMGAVMGSKNLKAIAVRGRQKVAFSDAKAVSSLAKWFRDRLKTHPFAISLGKNGSVTDLAAFNTAGGLPTRNFRQGVFEGADKISAEAVNSSILVRRRSCYACPIRCKPEVATGEPYNVNPIYGGPEYQSMASLGSNCGIDNLEAIAKGNELCNAYGLDTISTGGNIAFAMECFEQGILTEKDTGGLKLNFGNAQAMVQLVEMIAKREGIGKILAEGVVQAAQVFGKGSEDFAMHVKGQGIPMHEPRFKPGLGVGYTISPTGADHCHNMHDNLFVGRVPGQWRALGLMKPLPYQDLSPAKIRQLIYVSLWQHVLNCLLFCLYVPSDPRRLAELVRYLTGWNITVWELMKVGERCINMARAFNIRQGMSKDDDCLPRRFLTPLPAGPLKGVSLDKKNLDEAIGTYYAMVGWDKNGVPAVAKLQELDIEWVAEYIKK